MSTNSIGGLDSSVLLGYYQTQLNSTPSAIAAANATSAQSSATSKKSATANDVLPWQQAQPSAIAKQAQVLNTTNFLSTTNVPLTAGATSDTKLEQDNQKLFSIYNAVNSLAQLAQMAQSSTATTGQQAGLNTRFQAGLAQVQQYLVLDHVQRLYAAGRNARRFGHSNRASAERQLDL